MHWYDWLGAGALYLFAGFLFYQFTEDWKMEPVKIEDTGRASAAALALLIIWPVSAVHWWANVAPKVVGWCWQVVQDVVMFVLVPEADAKADE